MKGNNQFVAKKLILTAKIVVQVYKKPLILLIGK